MARERTGCIVKRDGKTFVRVGYTDETGKKRELMRRAKDKADARSKLKELLTELDRPVEVQFNGVKMTFAELADEYSKSRIIAPVYRGEQKISGMRSHKKQLGFLKPLLAYFGRMRIRQEISPAHLEKYRQERMGTPCERTGKERSACSPNRELSLMRAMFNYAQRRGYITESPFDRAEKSLISTSSETKRERVLRVDEEAKLLAVCTGKRSHLKPLIITAVSTGFRRGELLTLRWNDIDFIASTIRLRAFNTKTARSREIPICNRLCETLLELRSESAKPDDLVFTCGDVKRSFTTACRLAEIVDLHFHDLRHTFATRLSAAGLPLAEIARLLGHSTIAMSYRYANINETTLSRAAAILEGYVPKNEMQTELRPAMIS